MWKAKAQAFAKQLAQVQAQLAAVGAKAKAAKAKAAKAAKAQGKQIAQFLAAKAGAAFISPFVGRLDDLGADGMNLIADICTIYNNYEFSTEVLVASARHPQHFVDAALLGANVITLPPVILAQLYKHPLTDKGLAAFLSDWENTGQSIT